MIRQISLKIFSILIFLFISLNIIAFENDTIKITLKQAEKQFLDSNLLLLSQKYNIDEKIALEKQARIWDLPNISYEHVAYQSQVKKWFVTGDGGGDPTKGGEYAIQVQQLITIAGKRNRQVLMAKENTKIAEYQFYDLLRTLKYQLRSDFYSLWYGQETISVYDKEIKLLEGVVDKYEKFFTDGYISLKDVVRLKSLLLSLQTEQLDVINDVAEKQADLKVLLKLGNNRYVLPVEVHEPDSVNYSSYNLSALIDSASVYRTDLQASGSNINYSRYDLSYQKSLAVPDIQVMAGLDKEGSYIQNYNYVGVAIDLPLWNHNKGNIRAANARYNESQLQYQVYNQTVANDVITSYQKALETEKLNKSLNNNFLGEFSKLLDGVNDSFSKHKLNLMEFVDMYESYKDSHRQYFNLQLTRMLAKEEINYSVGKDIIK
jgi:cobalt-zinc-cadmium efflux system outer membrane protein